MMKLQSILLLFCAGDHSLLATQQEEHQSYNFKSESDLHYDYGRVLQQVDGERDDPTPTPLPTLHPRTPGWGPAGITRLPTKQPTVPQDSLSGVITRVPTKRPSRHPTSKPAARPSRSPSVEPSSTPSSQPTSVPSISPSASPTLEPSSTPSSQPTSIPSISPSESPTLQPSAPPSSQPTEAPSTAPSAKPTITPSLMPSNLPTSTPSASPSSGLTSLVQVSLQAGKISHNGIKVAAAVAAAFILSVSLFVKRDVILGKGGGEGGDEIPSSPDIEKGEDGRNITYPLPPSAVSDTRTYKTKERSERPPYHIFALLERTEETSQINSAQ
jgi:hypothetical protein